MAENRFLQFTQPDEAAPPKNRFEQFKSAAPSSTNDVTDTAQSLWDSISGVGSSLAKGAKAGFSDEQFSGPSDPKVGGYVGAAAALPSRALYRAWEGLLAGVTAPGRAMMEEGVPGTRMEQVQQTLPAAALLGTVGGGGRSVTPGMPRGFLRAGGSMEENPLNPVIVGGGGRAEPLPHEFSSPVPGSDPTSVSLPPQGADTSRFLAGQKPLPPQIPPSGPLGAEVFKGGAAMPEAQPGVPARPGGSVGPGLLPPSPTRGPSGTVLRAAAGLPFRDRALPFDASPPPSSIAMAIAKGDGSAIDKILTDKYRKAIKPGPLEGYKGINAEPEQNQRITTTFDQIIADQKNLNLKDGEGRQVAGLPKTLSQFAQAVDQQEKSLYNFYSRQTDQASTRVPAGPIAAKLRALAAQPNIADIAPSVANEALRFADDIERRGIYTPADAQSMIETLNEQVGKSYGTENAATRVRVLNEAARGFRAGLDTAMAGTNNTALRLRYQALRSVKQDLIQAARREANKIGGTIPEEIADMVVGEQILHGIISPTTLASSLGRAGATLAAKKLRKYVNDPNRAIDRMFRRRAYGTERPAYSPNVFPFTPGRSVGGEPVPYGQLGAESFGAGEAARGPNGGRVVTRRQVQPEGL